MSTDARRVKEPGRGPWAWRDYLPCCEPELDNMRVRAARANPSGINLTRWFGWIEAEFTGETEGSPKSHNTLPRYRRFLYELQADHQPKCGCGEAPRIHASVAFCRPSGVAA